MTAFNFHYWLQGSIELGGLDSLRSEEIKIILKHIEIVENKSDFISWLKGFLEGNSEGLSKDKFKLIKKELEKEFINITKDPLFGLDGLIPEMGPRDKRRCYC